MSTPSHALLVRFKSALPFAEVERLCNERAPEFRALSGLQQKYYLHDPVSDEVAGFYLWESAEALQAYSESELKASIAAAYQALTPPRIEVYEVLMPLREG